MHSKNRYISTPLCTSHLHTQNTAHFRLCTVATQDPCIPALWWVAVGSACHHSAFAHLSFKCVPGMAHSWLCMPTVGFVAAMSVNDFWTSGTGNGKFHSHFSGTGIQVENSNPIFGNGNENSIKFHSHFREREWEWKIPFPTFGTGIGGRYSREFPGTGTGMASQNWVNFLLEI